MRPGSGKYRLVEISLSKAYVYGERFGIGVGRYLEPNRILLSPFRGMPQGGFTVKMVSISSPLPNPTVNDGNVLVIAIQGCMGKKNALHSPLHRPNYRSPAATMGDSPYTIRIDRVIS